MGTKRTTTSPTGAYEILPQLLSRPSPGGEENLTNAFRAGEGFDCLMAKRGRNAHGGGDFAARARTRSHRKAEAADLPALEVGVADSYDQLAAAHNLIRERYAWRGYKFESTEPEDSSEQHNDLNVTFFAMEQASVVGTITLRLDGPHGLRADVTHGAIIQYARGEGRRIGELTRLALAERADSRRVLSSLFGLVYSVGRWVHEVTDVFVEVNPRHVAFYVRALGFAIVGDVKFCERVRAPSILLYANVDSLNERLELAVAPPPKHRNRRAVAAYDAPVSCFAQG